MRPSDLALALATSQFNTSGTSGTISPLVGNSMVHVKVVMDPSNTVVIPMARTLVLAKARERILTKFFQGGIALVEVKRRKLALRKPDGSLVVIDDNPTWRSIMDSVSYARRQRDHGPVEAPAKDTDRDRSSTKMVDKLTLYLLDADAIAKCQGSARDGGFLEPLPVSPAPAM
ncbi:hypothetical protein GGI12_006408 [Dipsacomyces acuminosporus]|nr:hypothetical protein GGI12_006408 [Dipsacomyces acuminosporus]